MGRLAEAASQTNMWNSLGSHFGYRGFGDSSNLAPSEEGLVIDARTVWNWLTEGEYS